MHRRRSHGLGRNTNTSPQNGYVVRKDATAKRLTATGAEFVPTFSQEFGGFIKQETTSSPRSSNRLPSRQNDRRVAKKLRQPAQSDGTAIMRSNFAYVGCRTTRERNALGKGISVFRIDETGQWQLVAIEETRPNPSFLTVEATGRFLYAVHGDGTEMSSFHIGEDGRLQAIGHSTSAGLNPVDVALDPTGRHLIVTNHLSGSLAVHYLLGDGRFGPLTDYAQITGRLGPHKIEQLSPKPHQTVFQVGGKRLFIRNKGTDTVSMFDFDATAGSLMECPSLAAQLREGTGRRNGVAHPAMPILFVVGELDSTVYALRISREGRLDPFQVVSCLPDNFVGFSRASAVVLRAPACFEPRSRQYLYVRCC